MGSGGSSAVRALDSVIGRSRVRVPAAAAAAAAAAVVAAASAVVVAVVAAAAAVAAGAVGELSSPGSAFSADAYFGIRSTPVLPQ